MSDRFTFVGHEPEYGYMHHRDLDTGLTLVAVHGQSYRIAATEERYPVPPDDGRWVPANSAEGKAAKARARLAAGAQGGSDETPGDAGSAGDTGTPGTASGTEGGE